MQHAACDGNLKFFETIATLPYFKDIVDDQSNKEGWTPLLWAVGQKDLAIVKFLVS